MARRCTPSGWTRLPARPAATTSPTTLVPPRSPGTPSPPAERGPGRPSRAMPAATPPRAARADTADPPPGRPGASARAAAGIPPGIGRDTPHKKRAQAQPHSEWNPAAGGAAYGRAVPASRCGRVAVPATANFVAAGHDRQVWASFGRSLVLHVTDLL